MAEDQVVVPGSHRPVATGAHEVGPADAAGTVHVTVTLRAPELPETDETPIDAAAFAEQYGAAQDDADRVTSALQGFGLTVSDVSLPTASLRAQGTVAQMEAAFGVSLHEYESDGQGRFRGRTGDIHVPAAIAGLVTGVFGLDARQVAKRKTTAERTHSTRAPKAVTPADVEARYAFPPGDAAGQRVAIAEFGGTYFAQDLTAFCEKYDRPVPTVTPVSVGWPIRTVEELEKLPQDQQQEILGETVEVMMDVQIVAALCPAADITVYFAPFSQRGWIELINAVIASAPDLPVAVSISWGLAEDSSDWSTSAITQIERRLHAAALLGVTICVSSGDDGAGDQVFDEQVHVNYPASSPHVLSVGGTELDGADEVIWWQRPGDRVHHGGSTGGGVSRIFHRPRWQQHVEVSSLDSQAIRGRVLPDVAALAGPPYYDLIFLGKDSPNGGTSAATPVWAALLARVAAHLPVARQRRFLAPLLYAKAASGAPAGSVACRDITSGPAGVSDNRSTGLAAGYPVGTGYDAVTGWGVPDGTELVTVLNG